MEPLPGLGRRAERRKIEVGLIRSAVVKARMWATAIVEVEISALKGGEWFRRGRLLMVSPVHGDYRRRQAEIPLIVLSKFPRPARATVVGTTKLTKRFCA